MFIMHITSTRQIPGYCRKCRPLVENKGSLTIKRTHLARQDADALDEAPLPGVLGPNLETEEAGEEEGPPEVVDELADLLGRHRDEALVAALLAILLLEDDGRHTPSLALLGREVPARGVPRHGEDHLVVLRVRPRVTREVVERRRQEFVDVVIWGGNRCGGGGEVPADEGEGERLKWSPEEHGGRRLVVAGVGFLGGGMKNATRR